MSGRTRISGNAQGVIQANNAEHRQKARSTPRRRGRDLAGITIGLVLWIAGAALSPTAAQDIQVLDLTTNEIIYDPISQRIYASVPSAAGPEFGNTITVIDPFTGTIESSVFIGSEPGPLALSDDGQFLYVGLDGAGSIRRYDIPAATSGLQFFLGSTWANGWYAAADIEVLPGNPNAIAVSRKWLDSREYHSGVAVYDDDIMRPNTTYNTGPRTPNNRIEFSESASLLYGLNTQSVPLDFQHISITVEGAEETLSMEGLITRPLNYEIFDIEFQGGVIYSTIGDVIDPVAMMPLGRFDTEGPVEADPARGKVFFLHNSQLQTFSLERFLLESSVPIYGIVGTADNLIRWGFDGLAFRTSGGQVFLISRLPPAPPGPFCEIELDDAFYSFGERIIANSFRVINQTAEAITVEGRLWFDQPDGAPYPVHGILPVGSFELPPGTDYELGPVTLARVPTEGLKYGQYAFNCRLLDPVTAESLALDVNPFQRF